MKEAGVLCLALLLLSAPVVGQPTDAAPPANGPLAAVPGAASFDTLPGSPGEETRIIERARQVVRAAQIEGGVYAGALADALIELGLAHRDAGEHDQAVTVFMEALQVARVSHGLHDLGQIPYLNRVIEENAILGRWEEVGDSYDYLYRIHKRNYGDKDPRLIAVLEQVVLAKLTVHKSVSTTPTTMDLQKNLDLLGEAVEIIELHHGDNIDRMAAALYRVVRLNYEIALQSGKPLQHRNGKGNRADNRSGLDRTARRPRRRSSAASITHEFAQPSQVISRTERNGRSALNRIEELYEKRAPSSVFPRALAIARQGDWQQLYSKGSGHRQYKQAYELLEESESGNEYTALIFGEPRLLPAMDWRQEVEHTDRVLVLRDTPGHIVEVAFDVPASGKPRNIDTRSLAAHLNDDAGRWQQHIGTWRFRPRMENGEPVTTRMVQRFLITDEGAVTVLEAGLGAINLAKMED